MFEIAQAYKIQGQLQHGGRSNVPEKKKEKTPGTTDSQKEKGKEKKNKQETGKKKKREKRKRGGRAKQPTQQLQTRAPSRAKGCSLSDHSWQLSALVWTLDGRRRTRAPERATRAAAARWHAQLRAGLQAQSSASLGDTKLAPGSPVFERKRERGLDETFTPRKDNDFAKTPQTAPNHARMKVFRIVFHIRSSDITL
jgi:hypothetical protein